MKTISSPWPNIPQDFDSNLLQLEGLIDSLFVLKRIGMYLNFRVLKKTKSCPIKRKKCVQLLTEIWNLYEQVKEKKDQKAKTSNKTKVPFYWPEIDSKSDAEILRRLRKKSYNFCINWKDSNF